MLHRENVLQAGVATRTWGFRGPDGTGTGRRSSARIWKRGKSGKQNKSINFPAGQTESDDLVRVQL